MCFATGIECRDNGEWVTLSRKTKNSGNWEYLFEQIKIDLWYTDVAGFSYYLSVGKFNKLSYIFNLKYLRSQTLEEAKKESIRDAERFLKNLLYNLEDSRKFLEK